MSSIKNFADRHMMTNNGQQFLPQSLFRSFLTEVSDQLESASADESLTLLETRLAGLTGRIADTEAVVSENRSIIEVIASSIEELAKQVQLLKQRLFVSDNTLYVTDNGKTYEVSVNETNYLPKVTVKRGWKYLRSPEDDAMDSSYQKAWKLVETEAIGVSETLLILYSQTEDVAVGDRLVIRNSANSYTYSDSNTITAVEMVLVQSE